MQITELTSFHEASNLVLAQIAPFELLKLGHQVFPFLLILQLLVSQQSTVIFVILWLFSRRYAHIQAAHLLDRRFRSMGDLLALLPLLGGKATCFRSKAITRPARFIVADLYIAGLVLLVPNAGVRALLPALRIRFVFEGLDACDFAL